MYDLIIIGAGPAGISAGIYAARKKIKTLLISKDFTGQVGRAFFIENYPGFEGIAGIDLMEKLKNHVQKFDIDMRGGEEAKNIRKNNNIFEVLTTENNRYESKAVIVASGRDPRLLKVSGESKFIGKGVSYCVTCDGPLFNGKTVAVIGGGNAGFEAANDLTNFCPKIFILEYAPQAKADELEQERANESEKIEIIYNADVKEIRGEDFVNALVYQDRISKKDAIINIEGVFVEIGSIPAIDFVKGLVEFNEKNEIKINPATCETLTPGLFAAGDVTNIQYKQAIIAAGEGAKAGLAVYDYLKK